MDQSTLKALQAELENFFFFSDDYTGRLSTSAYITALTIIFTVVVLIHAVVHLLLMHFSEKYRSLKPGAKDNQVNLTMTIVTLLAVIVISPCYFYASYQLQYTVESRWEVPSYVGQLGLLLHCGCTLYETLCYIFIGKSWEFFLHHILVLGSYTPVLLSGHLGFYAYFDGTVEVTNVFLCGITILRVYDLKAHIVYVLCGASLWLSFLIVRIFGMSYWLYLFVSDYSHNQEIFYRNLCLAKWTALPVTVFLLCLSSSWFVPITKGLLKAIGKKQN